MAHQATAQLNSSSETSTNRDDDAAFTARDKVFNTVELLDLIFNDILQDRPPLVVYSEGNILHQIFKLHRVNKAFYNHIFGQTNIAQELYLAPIYSRSTPKYIVRERGFLSRICAAALSAQQHNHETMQWMRFSVSTMGRKFKEQSWMRLFVSQPPVERLWMGVQPKVGCPCRVRHVAPSKRWVLYRKGGLTLGTIYTAAKQVLTEYEGCMLGWWVHVEGIIGLDGTLTDLREQSTNEHELIEVEE